MEKQKRNKQIHSGRRMGAAILGMIVAVSSLMTIPPKESEAATYNISNPRIVKDDSMESGQKVTWDCVWFGSYPQAEVLSTTMEEPIITDIQNGNDFIKDDALYSQLQSAEGWDDKGDITINGEKYHRMQMDDATYHTSNSSSYYNWWTQGTDTEDYHYFKYQPIKWRVLQRNGDSLFLHSDIALDDRKYNEERESVTWKTSTIRSWLNGYNAADNQCSKDYSSSNFIDMAFTSSEQNAISTTMVENKDKLSYGTEGGEDTSDKIFLLSESEVYTENATKYGFVENSNINDEARRRKSSTFSKAMGTWSSPYDNYRGNCWWWLRSPGYYTDCAAGVTSGGWALTHGSDVDSNDYGMCPALNLNLSSLTGLAYAGTVCSDGTIDEVGESIGESTTTNQQETEQPTTEAETTTVSAIETTMTTPPKESEAATYNISNPRIVKDDSMESGQKVTWDCVWFGSYPQAEVLSTTMEEPISSDIQNGNDFIKDDALYSQLQSAVGWNANGDITINGEKYHRMKMVDATHYDGDSYNWETQGISIDDYHYFKYQPIKWRVLQKEGNSLFLHSDIALDDKKYNEINKSVTWKTSTIRSWLNGYNAADNQCAIDYSSSNFFDTAFTLEEQNAILTTTIENKDNPDYGTEGGEDTSDKIFLLSQSDVYTENDTKYNFREDPSIGDEARKRKCSTFSKAMGTESDKLFSNCLGCCCWWLRSPGLDMECAAYVGNGWIDDDGGSVESYTYGLCPALNLNLSSLTGLAYAGTVCSDGTIDEVGESIGESTTTNQQETEQPTTEAVTNEIPSTEPTAEQLTTEAETTTASVIEPTAEPTTTASQETTKVQEQGTSPTSQEQSVQEQTTSSSPNTMPAATANATSQKPSVSGGAHNNGVVVEEPEDESSSKNTSSIKKKKVAGFKAKAGKKKVTMSWRKLKGATGYKIYMKTSPKGKLKLIKTTKKTNFNKTKLTSKKTYYFVIKAYKKSGGRMTYSKPVLKKVKVK